MRKVNLERKEYPLLPDNPKVFILAVSILTLITALLFTVFQPKPVPTYKGDLKHHLRIPLITEKKVYEKIVDRKDVFRNLIDSFKEDVSNGIKEIVLKNGFSNKQLKSIIKIAHKNKMKVAIRFDDSSYVYPPIKILSKVDHIYFDIQVDEKINYREVVQVDYGYDDYNEEYCYKPFNAIYSSIRLRPHPKVSVVINATPKTAHKVVEITKVLPKLYSLEIKGVESQPTPKPGSAPKPVTVKVETIENPSKPLVGLKQLLTDKRERKANLEEAERLSQEAAQLDRERLIDEQIARLRLKGVLARRAGKRLSLREVSNNKDGHRRKNVYQIWVENYILNLYYLERISMFEKQRSNL